MAETSKVAASALLRGARGNSGVILSLLFRGFSKGLKDKVEATGVDLAEALGEGVTAAYKAVMKPTEGTILTVAREAAEKAQEVANQTNDALTVFRSLRRRRPSSAPPKCCRSSKKPAWWTQAAGALW